MRTDAYRTASIVVEPVETGLAFVDGLRAWLRRPDAVVLDSSQAGHAQGRFSILAAEPVECFRAERWEPRLDVVSALSTRLRACPAAVVTPPCDSPFVGGWVGFLSYESGLGHESLATRKPSDTWLPNAQFNLYDTAVVFDTRVDAWSIVAVDWPPGVHPARGSAASRIERFRGWLHAAHATDDGTRNPVSTPESGPLPERPAHSCRANMSRDAYLRLAGRVQEYIAAGDVYQANLSMRFTAPTALRPDELYLRLRAYNPAPFSAYFPTRDATVLCSSPELFLNLSGRQVCTRPIKGTRPRTNTPALDRQAKGELLNDEKEQAELAMIVDLLRNDLGRVCEFGSVRVEDPGSLEAHPTVFHRVATITGRLREEQTWADVLRSTFPGGSITGAPKIRAMQIIDVLEPTPRGVYCGAIGWIGLDGSMRLNVAIRTMVHVGQEVHVYAGGAITADSDPEKEHAEILAKAAGMFRAVGCTAPIESHSIEAASIEAHAPTRTRKAVVA